MKPLQFLCNDAVEETVVAALRVVRSPNILKNRREMPRRKGSNDLVELTGGIPGSTSFNLRWTKKKRSNTLTRRNLKSSSFAALAQVDNSDLQPPLKVYE